MEPTQDPKKGDEPTARLEQQIELTKAEIGAQAPGSEREGRLQKAIRELQDCLDQLRLSVKYLTFDLEATRRENDLLRKQLREARGERPDGNEP